MGFNYKTFDLLDMCPSLQIYGAPGVGKTVAVATSFPNAAWLVPQAENLRAFASYCKYNWAEASQYSRTPVRPVGGASSADPNDPEAWEPRPPAQGGTRIIPIPRYDSAGREIRVFDTLTSAVHMLVSEAKETGIDAVVFDEMSEFGLWIDAQKAPGYGGIRDVKDSIRGFAQKLQAAGIAPIFVSHETAPTYEGGKLTMPGGPQYPFKNMREDLPKIFSLVLRMVLEQPKTGDDFMTDAKKTDRPHSVRLFQTESDELFLAKFRDFNPEIRPFEDRPLRKLMQMAGMKLGKSSVEM